jgi:AraC family transcriptional activator of tynA and feaB
MDCGMRTWTTDAVDAAIAFDYWVGAICECFLEMEADTSSPGRFSATLESTPLSDLRVNHVTGSAQRVYRTQRAISRSTRNNYYLLCKQATPCSITQHGAGATRLLPGDLTLIDSRRRYELDFPATVDTFSVQLPIAWLDTWLPHAATHLGVRVDGSAGWGHVLGLYIRQLRMVPDTLPTTLHCDHLGGLIALAFGTDRLTAPDASPGLLTRMDDCLRSRFAEPGLCATDVAEALGVSVRTLHRALTREERTFAASLMRYRMEAAERMLASPSCKLLTVAAIGRRAGLLDASHFTRAYRSWSGKTPGESRHVG